MKLIGPAIRILCGLVLLIVATSRYFTIRGQMAEAEGGEIQILGSTSAIEPGTLLIILLIAAVSGLALAAFGGYSLRKRMQEG